MDNEVLRLIKIITVLYLCNKKGSNFNHVLDEVKEILSKIKVDPRYTQGVGNDENVIENLRDSAEWLFFTVTNAHDLNEIISRLRLNCRDNSEYMDIIEKTLTNDIQDDQIDTRINSILNELRYINKKEKVKKIFSVGNAKLNFGNDYIDMGSFLTDAIGELSEVNNVMTADGIPGVEGTVDFGDPKAIHNALELGKNLNNVEGLLNTGYHGLNEAIGGGLIRGWSHNFGGISGGGKTLGLIECTLNVPKYTKPYMIDKTKIPCLLRVTAETTVAQDTAAMYQRMHWRDRKEYISLGSIDVDHAEGFMKDYFDTTGYKVFLIKVDPNKFSIFNLFQLVDSYIAQGYEIHMLVFDYLPKIAKHTPAPRDDIKLSLTYDLFRGYCDPKAIAGVTAAQLNTIARDHARANPSECTRTFSEGSWYENARSIYNELDIEIMTHAFKHIDGKSYWSLSRGKRREGDFIPFNKRDCYYEFGAGGLTPDIDGPSKAIYKLPSVNKITDMDIWD